MDRIPTSNFANGETEAGTNDTFWQRSRRKAVPLLSHSHGWKETLAPPVCPFGKSAASEPQDRDLLLMEEIRLLPCLQENSRLSVLCSSSCIGTAAPVTNSDHRIFRQGCPLRRTACHSPALAKPNTKLKTVDTQESTK